MSEHARVMHSDGYWRQYEIKIAFDKPTEVVGVVEALRETRNKPSDPWTPRLAIRQDDGILVIVDAYPTRLLAELVLARPAVGDRVRIRYLGEDTKAAPGLNPVKRFAVDVKRAAPPGPGDGTDVRGSASDNATGAGQ